MNSIISLPQKKPPLLVDNIFVLLFGAYLVLGTLRTTSLEYRTPPFFSAIIAAGLLAIIGAKFFLMHTYSVREVVLYSAVFAVVLVVVVRNHHDTLMMLFLLVLASKGIEFRRIVVIQLIAVTEVLLFSGILSQIGITADYGLSCYGDYLRTFGVCNTTDFASYILFLVIGYTFLRGNKITFAEVALFAAGNFWSYKQTEARTAFVSLLFFCILVAIYKLATRFSVDLVKTKITYLGVVVMPLLSFLLLGLSFLYSEQNALLVKIDQIFTNRIMLGRIGLERYGVGFFGNEVIEHGYGFREQPTSYFYLDSSYMRLVLIDGLLVYFLIMFLYSSIYKKMISGGNAIGMIALLTIALNCVAEQHLLEPWYNPFSLLYLAQLTSSKSENIDKNRAVFSRPTKNRWYILFTLGVFVILLLSINFHMDGSSITPGDYVIYRASSADHVFRWQENEQSQVFAVERDLNAVAPQEKFTLVHLEGKKYYIENDAGDRLTPQGEKIIIAEPSAEDPENQMWEILRWKKSMYFLIINVKSGLGLYANNVGPVQYSGYVDNYPFLFGFQPSP